MERQEARAVLEAARQVTVLTGAGISTDSGIPDFRGPQGVWTKNPSAERTSNLSHYLGDPEVRRLSWRQRLTSPAWDAKPNPGHEALVQLEKQARLVAVLTQNIDELHQRAGHDPNLVVELHGTMHRVICWDCGLDGPMGPALDRVRAGDPDPHCIECGGILKSATISFGQSLVAEDLLRAERAAADCDLLLAVGSTLAVFPAAGVVPVAVQHGAVAIIVNGQPTEMDGLADVVLRDSISECLPALVEGLTPTSPS
jgi:NAD-dependent deacetylase